MKGKILLFIIAFTMLVGCTTNNLSMGQLILNDFLQAEYTFKDIPLVLREPNKYINRSFVLAGKILDSRTLGNIQKVTIRLENMDTIISEYPLFDENNRIIEVEYNIKAFGNERLLEGEIFAFVCYFNKIKAHNEYGDILSFRAQTTMHTYDLIGLISLEYYFDSIGIDINSLGLDFFVGNSENMVFEDSYGGSYIDQPLAIFKTNNDIYWAIHIYDNYYDSTLILSSTGIINNKTIKFEEKQSLDLYELLSEEFE